MNTHKFNDFMETIEGAALILFHLAAPFLRSYRARWGAADSDLQRNLPGDDLVPSPKWQYTRAITINAPASEVWKWLVQIGANRGGLYSYDGLENLAGCNIHSADDIIPELQTLKAGDDITIHPNAPAMKVAAARSGQYILIHNDSREADSVHYINMNWLLYLEVPSLTTTRLISRGRYDYSPDLSNKLWMGPLFVEPVGFVMERKMLLGISQRAEHGCTLLPAWNT